jgi:putative flavoprotein involved in K+ transport
MPTRRPAHTVAASDGSEVVMTQEFDTVIIGGGQAGLATGYHLARADRSFVILEAHDRIGDNWRRHYDSLRLYSPARFNALPGWPGTLEPWTYPTKDELADYLEAYALRFELPVVTGVRVDELRRDGGRYVIRAGAHHFVTDNVVVASGTFQEPIVPDFATRLDPWIRQLHSSEYRRPDQLEPGPVLVVGASHSGADIALEVAASHPTVLSGRVNGELPFDIEGRGARVALPILWQVANHVLTVRTPIGRKVRAKVRAHGGPLLRVKRAHLREAGVELTEERVEGIRDGRPALTDGTVLEVANVIWCTGFGKDTSWIDLPVTGEDGWPEQSHGAAESSPGLYFVGLPFLFSFASMLVGGVGRDARRVASAIAA